MKSTRRMRLLIGALLVGLVVLLADRLTRGGPRPVAAAVPATQAAPPVWSDTAELEARLTGPSYESVLNELAALPRDLFVPTAQAAAELKAQAQPDPPQVAVGEALPPPFEETHHLVGVMLGPNPVAVVGAQVVPLRAELDGHVLITVARDRAVFVERSTGREVTLEIRPRAAPESPR